MIARASLFVAASNPVLVWQAERGALMVFQPTVLPGLSVIAQSHHKQGSADPFGRSRPEHLKPLVLHITAFCLCDSGHATLHFA